MSAATFREMQECAAREVKQRERVYPRLVAQGKMTQAFADKQIDLMGQIRDHFYALAEEHETEGRLI